ncbi:aminoacyl-tRNA hydrolase [Thermocrinis jamiesonii]|jgi:peptidyl-tRNA hydrolase|uniref:aminoacyl-tRNA hydrolase n=1 Tax=Thermocrinis jamiesonii TaxID=1302351 RepID=UPI00049617DB|nr:aminoacyl-tRNA hydrolase [Thermocrinis jamiesonii]
MIRLVVGLGNPGKKYERTRHNAGFMVVDELLKKLRVKEYTEECLSHVYRVRVLNREVLVAKPQTYMNNSGLAVLNLLEEYEITPENMMVIYDDLDLPLGRIRLRLEGSSGGHHGIESIIREIKTSNFVRLRIGIGRPKDRNKVVDYVLSPFDPEEESVLYTVLDRASECVLRCLETSPEESMNFCNAPIGG